MLVLLLQYSYLLFEAWHLFTVHNIQILAGPMLILSQKRSQKRLNCINYSHSTWKKCTCRIEHNFGIKSTEVFNEYFPPRILLLPPLFLQFPEQSTSHSLKHSSSSFQRPCLRHPIPPHSCWQLSWQLVIHCLPKLQLSPKQTWGGAKQPVTLPGLKLKTHMMKILEHFLP